MQLTPKIQQALNFAAEKHSGQKRKADGLPYIVHPFSVAWIVNNYTLDEEVVVAAFLHDILEDVQGYYYNDLLNIFGKRVAQMVEEVSEYKNPNASLPEDEKDSWLKRKKKYLKSIAAASPGALMICAADKIHNLRSMLDVYEIKGEIIWEKFNAPRDKKLWLYEKVYKILERRLPNKIVKELGRELKKARRLLK